MQPSPSPQTAQALYLSRVALRSFAGVYAAHKHIYQLTGGGRPLWRRYQGVRSGGDYAFVLAASPAQGCDHKTYAPQIPGGRFLRFALLADVSRSRKAGASVPEARGRRYDPVLEARLADPSRRYDELAYEVGTKWLTECGAKNGFEVVTLNEARYEVIAFVSISL